MTCYISYINFTREWDVNSTTYQVWTDTPSHCWARLTNTPPRLVRKTTIIRGLRQMDHVGFKFSAYTDHEQIEPGDSLSHTFFLTPWSLCQSKYIYIWGSKAGEVCKSTSPSIRFHHPAARSPTFHPLTPIPLTIPGTNYNWADFDLSPWLGLNATGAIVRIHNTSPGVRPWGIRMKGSTDDRAGDMSGFNACWGIIGVDVAQKIQFYNVHLMPDKVELHLVGYTTPPTYLRTNAFPIATTIPNNTWTTIDLTTNLRKRSFGVIVEIDNPAKTTFNWGIRPTGSPDERIAPSYNYKNQFCAIVGCGEAKQIDCYRQSPSIQFFLQGEIGPDEGFIHKAYDITPTPLSDMTPLIPLPTGGLLEGYRDNPATTFHLTGYASGVLNFGFVEICAPAGGDVGIQMKDNPIFGLFSATSHIWALQNGLSP